jgi:quinol---cytochrome-c reductase cytochrome c subunit
MGRGWRPVLVGAAIVIAVFVLAQSPIFEPDSPATPTTAGDVSRGRVVFERECAGCHGDGGEGGTPGPRLVDAGLAAEDVAATIEQGSGVMPPALVSGQDEADVVAYVVAVSRPASRNRAG